jgi:hypothetical protein
MRVGLWLGVVLLGCGGDDYKGDKRTDVWVSVAGGGKVTGTNDDTGFDCTERQTGVCHGTNLKRAAELTAVDQTDANGDDWLFSQWAPFRTDYITSSNCKPDSGDLNQRTIKLSQLVGGQDCLAVFRIATLTDIPIITIVMPEAGKVGDKVTVVGDFPGLNPSPTPQPSPAAVALVMFPPGILSEVTSASRTEIETTVPMGAVTGPITAFVPSGMATSPKDFTVLVPMVGGGSCGRIMDVKFDPGTASCGSGAGETVTIPLSLTVTVLNEGTQPLTVNGISTVTLPLAESCHISSSPSWMLGTGGAVPPGQMGTFTLTSSTPCMWAMGTTGNCEVLANVTLSTSCGDLYDGTMSSEGLLISVP